MYKFIWDWEGACQSNLMSSIKFNAQAVNSTIPIIFTTLFCAKNLIIFQNVLKCDFISVSISTTEENCVDKCCEMTLNSHITKSKGTIPEENSSSLCQHAAVKSSDEGSPAMGNEMESKDVQDQRIRRSEEINHLPASFYNVVVFSLLLTYIPSPKIRWEMCKKAYKVRIILNRMCVCC